MDVQKVLKALTKIIRKYYVHNPHNFPYKYAYTFPSSSPYYAVITCILAHSRVSLGYSREFDQVLPFIIIIITVVVWCRTFQ